jgi:predicted dehydrogenase
MSTAKVALLGAGGIAATHYRGYMRSGAQLLAFTEPVAAAREKRQTEWGVPGFETFDALLEAVKPEVVSICTPNAFHAPLTIQAAQNGIHVLSEKPLSMSIKDCNAMIEACKMAGVVLQTGHHLRANWYAQKAKAIIDSGELGRVTFIRLRQSHDWGGSGKVSDTFSTYARAGGGTLLDNGCHLMDLARFFAGDVNTVYARTATLAYPVEVEDLALAHLEFENGALASIENSWSSIGFEEGFWVYGTKGTLECNFAGGHPRSLLHHHRGSNQMEWGARDTTTYQVGDEGGHSAAVAAFLSSVQTGSSVICTGEDGRESVRLVLAAYQSAKLKAPVQVKNFE